MREFYEDILNRNPARPTPLEKIVRWECALCEDLTELHEKRMEQILEDIQRRKADGEPDWVVTIFEGLMARALRYGDPCTPEELEACSTEERHLRQIAQENRPAAQAYELRKQGIPCEDKAAERVMIRRYESLVGRMDGEVSAEGDHVRTMKALTGSAWMFHRDVTGMVQYRFYEQGRQLGSATNLILPDFPEIIQCNGLIFNSSFDPNTTMVPGMSRDIIDADDLALVAGRLTWEERGCHKLELFWEEAPLTIQIRKEQEGTKFYMQDRCVAETISLAEVQKMGEWDVATVVKFYEELSETTRVMLMSVPSMLIGL